MAKRFEMLAVTVLAALMLAGAVACAQPAQQASSSAATSGASVQQSSASTESGGASSRASDASSSAGGGSGQSSQAPLVLADCPVIDEVEFGGVYLDITIDEFNALGFAYGDSVDIEFSNGYKLAGIPYYNGYYTEVGDPLLVAYPGYPHVEVAVNYGSGLWETAGLADGDTATVTLVQAGAFLDVQEAFALSYTDDRADYGSDEEFANFRAMSGGRLRENVWYRSASPVDNEHNRVAYVNKLMADAGVRYDFNLSDSAEEIEECLAEDEAQGVDAAYFNGLYTAGEVATLNMGANYQDDAFKQTLAAGLVELSGREGPYLVHCVEGKDRTGFTCALIEGLAGATYQEIVDDYMITYANYYGITQESDPSRYNAVKGQNIDSMLRYLASVDKGADLTKVDFSGPARDYLRDGGMTDGQIEALMERVTG